MIFNDKVSIDKPLNILDKEYLKEISPDNYINTEGETYKYNDWIPYRRLIVEALDDPCDESFGMNTMQNIMKDGGNILEIIV